MQRILLITLPQQDEILQFAEGHLQLGPPGRKNAQTSRRNSTTTHALFEKQMDIHALSDEEEEEDELQGVQHRDRYWKEDLEKTMDSIWMQLLVMPRP